MASTSQYKATGRTVRAGMLEVSPTAGMKFTNNPITEGYCKTMVNMDVDTTLGVLRPRPAYEDNKLANLLELATVSNDYIGNDAKILFSGKLYVDIWDTTDAPTAIAPDETKTISYPILWTSLKTRASLSNSFKFGFPSSFVSVDVEINEANIS